MQALNVGQTLTDTFTVTTVDGTAQVVTITINGTNDAAVISGDRDRDGDRGRRRRQRHAGHADRDRRSELRPTSTIRRDWTAVGTPTASANGYGTYTLTAAGVWTYTLDDSNADRAGAQCGRYADRQFTALTVGRHRAGVTITIDGANDAAVITGDTTGTVIEAGGVANGTPGTSFVVGDLDAADVDNTSDSWTAIETPTLSANGYGTFTIDAAGLWIYILDNGNAAVQALNVGDTLTDTFTATTVDGTSQVVTITINGANDAAVITGTATGSVIEAGGVTNGTPGTPTATGDLNSTDVDNPERRLDGGQHGAASANGYGSYTLDRRRRVDLHARQQQRDRAGAQCRRHADRSLYRHHDRRHRPVGDQSPSTAPTTPPSSPATPRGAWSRPAASPMVRRAPRSRPVI